MVIFREIMTGLPATSTYGLFFGIWYSGGSFEQESDVEIGRMITSSSHAPVTLLPDLQLNFRELPAVPVMATYVLKGPIETVHIAYSAIGTWAELHGYRFAGPPRELALQVARAADGSDSITEIQFPVEPVR
jgi:effector-binding domain-containing protein